jgi:disabled family protein 2
MFVVLGTIERPGPSDVNDPLRFAGEGVQFRAKLIGVLEVNAPRGDRLCQEALGELKMAIKAAGEHKQRILICIALDGLRLRDERTGVRQSKLFCNLQTDKRYLS